MAFTPALENPSCSFSSFFRVPDQEAAIFDLIAGLKALKWKIAAVMAGKREREKKKLQ